MLTIALLLLALPARQPPAVDSLAVYSEILGQVRTEFPGRPVALATTRSGVDCMPLCGVRLRDPGAAVDTTVIVSPPGADHSPALLDSLRTRGLIGHPCAVRQGWYGCPDYPEHLFVALGEITTRPVNGPAPVADGVWVKVALLVPGTGSCGQTREPCHPDAMGYWYLLRRAADGTWAIVRRAPGFTA
jgi:hypothetical protein